MAMSTVESNPDSVMFKRFGNLKGREVKTVSESMKSFCTTYPKPILPQYRTLVNDLIQSTHLSVVNGCFVYDAIFAYGLHGIFFKLMRAYPGENEAKAIFAALVGCLDMDPSKIIADAESVASAAKEMSGADLEAAFRGEGSSIISEIAKAVKADDFYLYTKPWGLGLIQLMEMLDVPQTEEKIESLVALIGFPAMKAKQDLMQYKDVLEKTYQAEQLFKEIEIREKKKMAERLEEKAKRALEAAKQAEEAGIN